jgi:hypothetical protein
MTKEFKLTILLALLVFTTDIAFAQNEIFLKNKRSGRLKRLKQTTNFGFEVITPDKKEVGYFGRIVQMTDSTLTIQEYLKPSMRGVTPATYMINIRDIKSIKNYLINNDDFNTLGGMLVIGGILGLVATPIVWISEGKGDGTDGALFTAGLFGAGGLLLLPQFIGKRKQMSKWELVNGRKSKPIVLPKDSH